VAWTRLGMGSWRTDLCIQLRLLALGANRMGPGKSLGLLIKGRQPGPGPAMAA
jgi:hypothetical protein